ncbi:MAG TPA: hypothetical protein VFR55_12595, partial [Dehalococcoidia bacterium]|nr:hypothetical protein [Dehalococcoidia bacterium]
PSRPTYQNKGVATGNATGTTVSAFDLSHYCNPPVPGITIEKKTNGEDANGPNDTGVPKIAVGDEVTWTYTVTSTGNVPLADVFVEDDNGTPNTSDDFSPTFVSGDVNGNDLLDLDEIWEYTASDTAIDLGNAPGNVKTVEGCGTPSRPTYQNKGVATGNATGTTVSAFDLSHYCNPPVPGTIDIEKWTKIAAPSSGGDVCDTFGKPKQIKMRYTGDNVLEHTQASGKVIISGQLSGQSPVYIIASKNSDGGGSKFFDGTVNRGEQFVIDGTASKLGAQTYVLIYNHQGGARLKSINFHTSCSQPLVLGNRFGGIQLIGFSGEKGNSGPFDPAPDFGVDADTPPTGPSGPVGDGVTWTYFVTNPGTTPLHNVAVTDDNGTPGNPADDFSPLPVMGDDNGDHILDLDETWLYQKTGTVKSGQYKNIGQVSGVDPHGNTVRDQDPSHHIGVFPAGDICEGKGKLQTLTMRYTGGNTQDHSQAPGKVKVSGDPGSASPVRITVGAHFNGTVNLGEDFVIDATGSRLGANTKVLIKDQTGKLLQEIDFHTSCSQPLERGDRFGAIQVINATSTR